MILIFSKHIFVNWFLLIHDCPSTLCKLLFFSLDTHGARSTKSHPNFSLCENYIFSLDTHGAGSTIVQALCVNYYFFTWYSWGTVHKIPPQLFTLWKLYFLTWYWWGRIHDCPSTKKFIDTHGAGSTYCPSIILSWYWWGTDHFIYFF